MAIALEFFSVVTQKTTVAAKYPGGVAQCKEDFGLTFLMDEHLIRGGAMNWFDVEFVIRHLESRCLRYLDNNGKAVDIVVVDMIRGPMTPCDWIEFDNGVEGPRCWLRGCPPGVLSKPTRSDDSKDCIVTFEMTNGIPIPVWKAPASS